MVPVLNKRDWLAGKMAGQARLSGRTGKTGWQNRQDWLTGQERLTRRTRKTDWMDR
jgi:hypothetical protein